MSNTSYWSTSRARSQQSRLSVEDDAKAANGKELDVGHSWSRARDREDETLLSSKLTVGTDPVTVEYESRGSYGVHLCRALRPALESELPGVLAKHDSSNVLVVSDHKVMDYASELVQTTDAAGTPVIGVHAIDGDEKGKTISAVQSIWSNLHASNAQRRTMLIAIGGGVTMDVAGFAASTYMRGIPYVLVPTSLMAQIDASIGGKVGFNDFGRKNVIGAFYNPSLVVIATDLLKSLSRQDMAAGLAEAIKVGLLSQDEQLLLAIEELAPMIDNPEERVLRQIVELSIRTKLELLSGDPLETTELKRDLNLGHCVGHAIEAESDYSWTHGRCVAAGMAVALRVGLALGITPADLSDRVIKLLDRLNLPITIPEPLAAKVNSHLYRIAQVRNGALNLVIPTGIGRTAIIEDWPRAIAWNDVAR